MDDREAGGALRRFWTARRASAVLAAMVSGSIAIVGCGAPSQQAETTTHSATEVPTHSTARGQVVVGNCWQEDDYVAAGQWLIWEGSDPVDCQREHNSITFAVPELGEDFPYPFVTDHGPVEPTDAASAQASFSCRAHTQGLLPAGSPEASMVQIMWYLPSEEQWTAGQRQVRCDLTWQSFDVTRSEPQMRSMPATLSEFAAAQRSDPLDYEACALTVEGITVGPFAEPTTTKLVRCDGAHTWRWLERIEMVEAADARYPGDAAMETAFTTACVDLLIDSDQAWWAFPPSAATWALGDRSIDCWSGRNYLSS